MKNKLFLIVAIFTITIIAGCSKFLDINKDPNNPATAREDFLLTGIQTSLSGIFTIGKRLDGALAVYTHQITSRENDKYGMNGETYELSTSWYYLYSFIGEIDYLIEKSTENGNLHYAGVAKLIKAYAFAQAVDAWGDIPYSEMDKFSEGIKFPKYDKDEEVYDAILVLIDEAIKDLENKEATNLLEMGGDDLIYGGDIEKWVRMANTLKLKMYNNMRLVRDVSAEVKALIDADKLISKLDQDFEFWYNKTTVPDQRHPLFVREYGGAQITFYISPWLYETMKGVNDEIVDFVGISDPRIPYYFCNQITSTGKTENPPEYRDGGFVSIYFGSDGNNRDHGGRATFTMVGIYACGGRWDDGKGGKLTAKAASGVAPARFITVADRYYIQAELVQAGVVTGDVKKLFEIALKASFLEVNKVTKESGEAENHKAPLFDLTKATDKGKIYIDKVLNAFDAAVDPMEIIMTEKWISTFGKGLDQYTDYRRTGYPKMWEPGTMTATGGPNGSGQVPTSGDRKMQLSLPWSQSQLNINPNSPAQKTGNEPVFWDKQ